MGYFLWRDRESNSSAGTADEATQGREPVFVRTSQEQNNNRAQQRKIKSALTLPSPASGRGEKLALSCSRYVRKEKEQKINFVSATR
ncbi:MAG TPA: hypothetical protein VHC92_12665, partial [Rhodanobacteraceae bacterium]|nr:hypothetical protein [Rhodanobacteraceae bacterium]